MSQAPSVSPELVHGVVSLARARLSAARNWALYPPEQPAVAASLQRLSEAISDSTSGVQCSIGFTPDTPLFHGEPLPPSQPVADAAQFLHDRDILRDLTGYPKNIGHRDLNLCTMIVSIADVFDALRSTRLYREGLASDRVKAIMEKREDPSFNQHLLKRFVNLMGLFPVGNLVRLNTEEVAIVTAEHPSDPFRPQVKILHDARGDRVDEPFLANTWERNDCGDYPRALIEGVDPATLGVDPLTLL